MPKIENWIIDKVLDATKIEEVVGEFVTLRKAGVNMTGLCPFHEDHEDGKGQHGADRGTAEEMGRAGRRV